MLVSVAIQRMPPITTKGILLTCVPGAELPSHTRGIPAMQYPAPWLMAVQEENIPQNLAYLLLCSWIGSMLLKAVSLHPCSLLQAWMSSEWCVVFGLVLCLPSTSFALAGSWHSHHQEQHCQPPRGSANIPARNTCTEWKHPHSLATGKNFSSWTWRERREARQRELRERLPRQKSHDTPVLQVTFSYAIWSNKP